MTDGDRATEPEFCPLARNISMLTQSHCGVRISGRCKRAVDECPMPPGSGVTERQGSFQVTENCGESSVDGGNVCYLPKGHGGLCGENYCHRVTGVGGSCTLPKGHSWFPCSDGRRRVHPGWDGGERRPGFAEVIKLNEQDQIERAHAVQEARSNDTVCNDDDDRRMPGQHKNPCRRHGYFAQGCHECMGVNEGCSCGGDESGYAHNADCKGFDIIDYQRHLRLQASQALRDGDMDAAEGKIQAFLESGGTLDSLNHEDREGQR